MPRSAATLSDLDEVTSEVAFMSGIPSLPLDPPSPILQLVQQITDPQNAPEPIAPSQPTFRSVEELRAYRRAQGRPERINRPWNDTHGLAWNDAKL